MTGEQFGEQPPEHEGDRYLRLLGLEELADQEIVTTNGVIQGRNFLDVCGEHARPMLRGFANMNPQDPNYDLARNVLRTQISRYVVGDNPG